MSNRFPFFNDSQRLPFRDISVCVILALLLIHFSVFAWQASVLKIHDGDTIEVTRKGREVEVCFYGIGYPVH